MDLNDDGESFGLPPPSPRRARVGDVHRPRLITELPREVIQHVTEHLTLAEATRLRNTSRNDMGIPPRTNDGGPLDSQATDAEMHHIMEGIERPTIAGRLVSGPLNTRRLSHGERRVIPMVPMAARALVGGYSSATEISNKPSPLKDQHPDIKKLLRRVGYIP